MIHILHIDKPYLPKLFTPTGNGLWQIDLTGVEEFICLDAVGKYTDIPQITPTKITSVRLGLSYYDLVDDISSCFLNPKTFYYDKNIYRLYINICDNTGLIGYQVPWGQKLEIGITEYFTDRVDYSRDDGAYYSDNYHFPIVSSIGDRNEKRDRAFYDNVSYTSVDVELSNYNGKFDNENIANRVARLYQLEDGKDFDSAVLQHYGIVAKPNITNTKVNFAIDDLRKSLDVNIDLGRINTKTFLQLKATDDDEEPEDKIFPIAIGKIENYQPRCINKGDTANDNAGYALCKTYGNYRLKNVSRVWVQKNDANDVAYDLIFPASGETISDPKPISEDSKYAEVCTYPYSVDYATGILYVNRASVCTAEINDDEVTYSWNDLNVNYHGWYNSRNGENENLCSVDLIRIGLEVFGGIDYEAWNYDLTNFSIERVKALEMTKKGWQVSVLIDDDKTIIDFLKEICSALHITYKLRGDNKYIVKVYETEAAGEIKYRITPQELFDRTDNHAQSTSEVLTTVKITYGYAGNSDNSKTLTDDTREEELEQELHVSKSTEFSTILSDVQAAQNKATSLLDASLTPPTSTTFKLWLNTSNSVLSVSDTIAAPRNRNNDYAVYNITQVVKSFKNNTLTITANKISDIDYTDYIQGNCYRSYCYKIKPFASTTYIKDI